MKKHKGKKKRERKVNKLGAVCSQGKNCTKIRDLEGRWWGHLRRQDLFWGVHCQAVSPVAARVSLEGTFLHSVLSHTHAFWELEPSHKPKAGVNVNDDCTGA